jgi:uncharacterized HAD superfamily protein/hypoxanthine phosphoribosyltransferase
MVSDLFNYRSFSDLNSCIVGNLWKIPADVDLVAGIPRSGLLAANIIALHLNLPLTTLEGLLEGRVFAAGKRLNVSSDPLATGARRIAIVDDSIATGAEMRRARTLVESGRLQGKVVYIAIYAAEETARDVDVCFEICPLPRVFAWNLMHREALANACVDIDGVLCVDPSELDNDDGPRYQSFLATARPLYRPTSEIGTLVTCRLERYRPETERWLNAHGIRYRDLVMWGLPDKKTRLALGGHAEFKAAVYRGRPDADHFIESSAAQAQVIANLAFKSVICVETQRVCWPGDRELVIGALRNSPVWMRKGFRRVISRSRNVLLRMNRSRSH